MEQASGRIAGPATGLRVSPVFIVRDVPAAAEYYRDRLGFTDLEMYGQPPCFCTLRLGEALLMLQQTPENPIEPQPNHRPGTQLLDAHILVDNATRMHAFCEAAGADLVTGLRIAPYGMLEFIVRDLDGYALQIGQNM